MTVLDSIIDTILDDISMNRKPDLTELLIWLSRRTERQIRDRPKTKNLRYLRLKRR